MLNQRYGSLIVVSKAPSDPKWGMSRWACRCDCGREVEVPGRYLRNSKHPSCGCFTYQLVSKGSLKYGDVAGCLANTLPKGSCLEWKGQLTKTGYARTGHYKGKNVRHLPAVVHRRVFLLQHGWLPPVVMHTCDNRKCINPDHLVAGTKKLNTLDAQAKGRLRGATPKYWVMHEGRKVTLPVFSRLTGTPLATLQWRARNGKLDLMEQQDD